MELYVSYIQRYCEFVSTLLRKVIPNNWITTQRRPSAIRKRAAFVRSLFDILER